MNRNYVIAFSIIALLLAAGCAQKQAEQPAATTTAAQTTTTAQEVSSSLGGELKSAENSGSELGSPDTAAMDDVSGAI